MIGEVSLSGDAGVPAVACGARQGGRAGQSAGGGWRGSVNLITPLLGPERLALVFFFSPLSLKSGVMTLCQTTQG